MKKNLVIIPLNVLLVCLAICATACGSGNAATSASENSSARTSSASSESESSQAASQSAVSSTAADAAGADTLSADTASAEEASFPSESDDGTDSPDNTDSTDGIESIDGTEGIDNTEEVGSTDSNDGTKSADGTERSDDTESADNTEGADGAEDTKATEAADDTVDPAIATRNETIYFTVDGTTIYLDETLQELVNSGLSFTYHDNISGSDTAVDAAFCDTAYNDDIITITVTDASGNPVSISLWNKWLDTEPETLGELTVMNIGIAEPAPTAWSQASTGPYGIYIGMSESELLTAAGEPESHVQFVKSPEWLYSGDNYTMTVNVSGGQVKGIWIENAVKARHD